MNYLLLLFLFASNFVFAQNLKIKRSNIANNRGIFLLKNVISVIPDSLEKFDINQVSSPDFQKNFNKSAFYDWTKSNIKLHWIRFTIENTDVEKLWLLHLHASEIKLYSPDTTAFNMVQSGYLLPISEKIYGSNFGQCIYVPIRIIKNQTKTFFCKISTQDFPILLPETIVEPQLMLYQAVSEDSHSRFLPQALYVNVSVTLALFCGLMYWLQRRKKYLYICLHAVSVCFLLAYLKGFSLELLFFNVPYFNYHIFSRIVFWLYGFSLLLMVKKLFDLSAWNKKLDIYFRVCLFLSPVFYIFPLNIGFLSFFGVAGTHLFVEVLLFWGLGFYFYISKRPLHKVYMVAFSLLFLSILINLYLRNIDLEVPYFNLEDVALVALPFMLLFAQMKHYRQEILKQRRQQNRLILHLEEYKLASEDRINAFEQDISLKTAQVKMLDQNLEKTTKELENDRIILKKQQEQLEFQNQNISLSIEYAKNVQDAIFWQVNKFKQILPEYFLFFKPKEVISGDFYWFYEKNNIITLIVADCSDYGVLGALMSMIGEILLKEIVVEKQIQKTNLILSELNHRIRQTLLQNQGKIYEGWGVSVCVVDQNQRKMTYSGAMNPLYYIQNEQLIEVKAQRYPIGGIQRSSNVNFESHEIDISKPTHVYLCTDGYQDQFGGEKSRKFMARNFKALLQSIHHLPMPQQEKILEKIMNAFMGKYKQMDDMLVLGLHF